MKKSMILGRKGFSLLEITIVLGIAGIVIAGIWLIMAQINENSRNARLVSQVTETIANARQVFGRATELPNVSGTQAFTRASIAGGVFPSDMVRNATTAIHAQRSNAYLAYAVSGGGSPLLNLTLAGMRSESCTYAVTKIVGSASARQQYGIVGLLISATGTGETNVISNLDIPVATLIEACSVANPPAAGFNVTFQFTIM